MPSVCALFTCQLPLITRQVTPCNAIRQLTSRCIKASHIPDTVLSGIHPMPVLSLAPASAPANIESPAL